MKKARNILVVTLMLLAVLSFGSVANTYAKYTSTADLSDTARVAKWDIEVGGQKIWEAEDKLTADLFTEKNASGEKIIAPGSEGSATIPVITNKSEVAADYTVTFAANDFGIGIPLEYCTNGTCATDDDWKSAATVAPITGTLAPGEDTSSATQTIKWRWAYYKDDAQDKKDTELGIASAKAGITADDGSTTVAPKIELALSITATQAAPVATP